VSTESVARAYKQAAEKVCTGRESNTSGAKALIAVAFTARLKSCPDTRHEFSAACEVVP
jgi:hypothetical protein